MRQHMFVFGLVLTVFLSGCGLDTLNGLEISPRGIEGRTYSILSAGYKQMDSIRVSDIRKQLSSGINYDCNNWKLRWENDVAVPQDVAIRIWSHDTLLYDCRDFQLGNRNWNNWSGDMQALRVEVGGQIDSVILPFQAVSTNWIQDFHSISIDSVKPSPASLNQGDTISVWVRMNLVPSANLRNVELYSSYTGLRTIGDYVVNLQEGQSVRLQWVVTALYPTGVDLKIHWYEGGVNSLRIPLR